jgi:hypothetical protein
MKFAVLILGLACTASIPANAQSIGGSASGTMTPPAPGTLLPAKAAITGSPAVGDATRDPGLATAHRSSSAQPAVPASAPEATQPPQPQTEPNKNYAGGTVAPKDGR